MTYNPKKTGLAQKCLQARRKHALSNFYRAKIMLFVKTKSSAVVFIKKILGKFRLKLHRVDYQRLSNAVIAVARVATVRLSPGFQRMQIDGFSNDFRIL